MELVYIIQNRVEQGIVYFFLQIVFRVILFSTLGCLDNIEIVFDSLKYRIPVFYMREHMEQFYIFQNRVEQGIVYFFRQIIFRAILFLSLWCLNIIQIFFDSHEIRISVFYMREHTELVYILQNRVEKGIVYFFLTDYIESNFF